MIAATMISAIPPTTDAGIREFFKNILRKSLYEYYFSKKDEKAVKKIEEMWVNV